MNKHNQPTLSSLSDPDQNDSEDSGPKTLISAAKLHETKIKSQQKLTSGFELDPLYTPFIKAAESLRHAIETQTKEKIESIKHETAEQTKAIYDKLSDARDEFKYMQQQLADQEKKLEDATAEETQLRQTLMQASEQINQLQNEIKEKNTKLSCVDNHQNEALATAQEAHQHLITKLQAQINQVNCDYKQQLNNTEQKFTYQQQKLNSEAILLREENAKMSEELNSLKQEKSEKCNHSEVSLELANAELERLQNYVKELEEKNNTIQKELFENWIKEKGSPAD